MELINCTPHNISLYDDKGNHVMTIAPTKNALIRIETEEEYVEELVIDHQLLYITREHIVSITRLPEEKEGVKYIVSGKVLSYSTDRDDLISPNTNNPVRDRDGKIIGVKGFLCR
jgi:hypothetical protein